MRMSTKTIGQKLYEKFVALRVARDLVVVRAVDPNAPHGYAWIVGLRLEGGTVAPLARLLTSIEIARISPRLDDPLTERIEGLLSLEEDLAALSPDELVETFDARKADPEWGIPQPLGSADPAEA